MQGLKRMHQISGNVVFEEWLTIGCIPNQAAPSANNSFCKANLDFDFADGVFALLRVDLAFQRLENKSLFPVSVSKLSGLEYGGDLGGISTAVEYGEGDLLV